MTSQLWHHIWWVLWRETRMSKIINFHQWIFTIVVICFVNCEFCSQWNVVVLQINGLILKTLSTLVISFDSAMQHVGASDARQQSMRCNSMCWIVSSNATVGTKKMQLETFTCWEQCLDWDNACPMLTFAQSLFQHMTLQGHDFLCPLKMHVIQSWFQKAWHVGQRRHIQLGICTQFKQKNHWDCQTIRPFVSTFRPCLRLMIGSQDPCTDCAY